MNNKNRHIIGTKVSYEVEGPLYKSLSSSSYVWHEVFRLRSEVTRNLGGRLIIHNLKNNLMEEFNA